MATCDSVKKHSLAENPGKVIIKFRVGTADAKEIFHIHKAILERCTTKFNGDMRSSLASGKPVVIGNVCAHVFRQFRKYLYNGTVDKAPSKATFKVNYPININPERYEKDLQIEYERGVSELACFYKFAEDHDISDLMNTIADALQDSVYESGAGLSAFMNDHIIAKSNKGSKLREMCVASDVLTLIDNCSQHRQRLMLMCITVPDYFEMMMKWMSGNFNLMGRHYEAKFHPNKNLEGFSVFNRAKVCPCLFHVHAKPTEAHPGHKDCPVASAGCGHRKSEMNNSIIDPIIRVMSAHFGNGPDGESDSDVDMSSHH